MNPVEHYVARFRAAPGDPLAGLRRRALRAFAERGFPSTRDEEWRYTSLAALARTPFERPEPAEVARQTVESLAIPVYACSVFVFVDGRLAPGLSTPALLAGQVAVRSLAAGMPPALGSLVDPKQHPFAALNTAFFEDGAALVVPDGVAVERPMHVVFVGSRGVQHPRVFVELGRQASATLIQDHVSLSDEAGFTNAVTEIRLGPGARLDFVQLQRETARRYHLSNLQVRQERDSLLRSHAISLGGALLRNDAAALLAGEGAECRLDGLFVGDAEQVIDHHTLVDHAVPHCTSRQLYKGVVSDRARGVFRGRVIVRPDAQKTDASQSNPNLVLSDAAEIDTRPQLEIYADDVKCSHGSSIGQVDADALFYLRSRGLDERRARDLLARGFAAEVTSRLAQGPLREVVDQLVLEKLAR